MSMNINRRDLVRGMIGGAVSLALTPSTIAQVAPPPGIISLSANENPYGPSPKALKEAHRVLRYGGRFFCMEFSTTTWPGFKEIYDVYSHKVMPQMGKIIAQDEDSYRYLAESIRRFPPMPEFERMIREAGFANTRVEAILGGAVAIHSGWKV